MRGFLVLLIILLSSARSAQSGEISAISTKKISLTGSQYKVRSGDCLWEIALGAYGDSYAWVKLARANSLENPDLIYPDQVLKIAR